MLLASESGRRSPRLLPPTKSAAKENHSPVGFEFGAFLGHRPWVSRPNRCARQKSKQAKVPGRFFFGDAGAPSHPEVAHLAAQPPNFHPSFHPMPWPSACPRSGPSPPPCGPAAGGPPCASPPGAARCRRAASPRAGSPAPRGASGEGREWGEAVAHKDVPGVSMTL